MKKKIYSFQEKRAYYERLRKDPNVSVDKRLRAILFLQGIEYVQLSSIKKTIDTEIDEPSIRSGFYAGIKAAREAQRNNKKQ